MIEIFGIVGTLFILLAFIMNDKKWIRILNNVGAFMFIIYGILIHSPSVWILNTGLVIINTIKILKNK